MKKNFKNSFLEKFLRAKQLFRRKKKKKKKRLLKIYIYGWSDLLKKMKKKYYEISCLWKRWNWKIYNKL